MKQCLLVFSLLLFTNCTSESSDSISRTTDSNPTDITAHEFQILFKAPSGLEWGKDIGSASNGCVNSTKKIDESKCTFTNEGLVAIDDSEAAKMCHSLKSGSNAPRLPTLAEQSELFEQFDQEFINSNGTPTLTEKGKKQFLSMFPDTHDGKKYWTSTVFMDDYKSGKSDYVDSAYTFDTVTGGVDSYYWNRTMAFIRVRCVRDQIRPLP